MIAVVAEMTEDDYHRYATCGNHLDAKVGFSSRTP